VRLTVTNPVTADELLARLVWVVNPKSQTVTAHSSLTNFSVITGQDILSGGDLIPGFQMVEESFVE